MHNVNEVIMKNEIICKNLIELRTDANMTQQQIADYLEIDRSNYSKYELGKLTLSVDMLIKLAKLYNVSADYILGLEE